MLAIDGTAWLRDDIGIIDLWYQGVPHVNAAYVFDIDGGFALIETGPASAHEHLMAGIKALGRDPRDLRHILVTHIHLDHSGGVGTLIRQFPQVDVFVHEIGAPHLIDPSNLLRSAGRIYGDQMDALWGTTLPVPEDRVWWLSAGEVVSIGERVFDVLPTQGHASHHVSYVDRATKVMVAGDVAGVRIPPSRKVWPPTPPPEFNLELWQASIARIRKADPTALLISHFGLVEQEQITTHLDELSQRLVDWVALVEQRTTAGHDRDAIVADLMQRSQEELHADQHVDLAHAFSIATPYGMSVDGILRYLRKRGERS